MVTVISPDFRFHSWEPLTNCFLAYLNKTFSELDLVQDILRRLGEGALQQKKRYRRKKRNPNRRKHEPAFLEEDDDDDERGAGGGGGGGKDEGGGASEGTESGDDEDDDEDDDEGGAWDSSAGAGAGQASLFGGSCGKLKLKQRKDRNLLALLAVRGCLLGAHFDPSNEAAPPVKRDFLYSLQEKLEAARAATEAAAAGASR